MLGWTEARTRVFSETASVLDGFSTSPCRGTGTLSMAEVPRVSLSRASASRKGRVVAGFGQ